MLWQQVAEATMHNFAWLCEAMAISETTQPKNFASLLISFQILS